MRGSTARSGRSGKWFTRTIGGSAGTAASRASVIGDARRAPRVARRDTAPAPAAPRRRTAPSSRRPTPRPPSGDSAGRRERVVVEREARGDDGGRRTGPHEERILGRDDAGAPAGLDQPRRSAPRRACVSGHCRGVHRSWLPGIQITRAKRAVTTSSTSCELCQRVAGVAGEDQPVVGMGRQGLDGAAVGFEADVQVAEGPERHGRASGAGVGSRPSGRRVVTGRSAPSPLDGQRQPVLRRGPGLPELPAPGARRRSRRRSGSPAAPAARSPKAKSSSGNRQAHAPRLDVGLLQRPVVEEGAGCSAAGSAAQVAHFGRREVALGHAVASRTAIDALDVHADPVSARHRQRHQTVGVRHVEGEAAACRPAASTTNGQLVRVGHEAPVARARRAVGRERQPHQRPRDRRTCGGRRRARSAAPRALVGGQQRPRARSTTLVGHARR